LGFFAALHSPLVTAKGNHFGEREMTTEIQSLAPSVAAELAPPALSPELIAAFMQFMAQQMASGAEKTPVPSTPPSLLIPNQGIIKRSADNLFGDLCDEYLKDYRGRDTTRYTRTEYWKGRIGNLTIGQIDDDVIRDELDHLATRPALSFHGRDAHGNAIHKTRGKALSGSTLNRYRAALSAILTWAQKKGITPKNYVHPCTAVPLQEEGKPRLRYLTSEEITRLLDACRNSRWAALWLIVRMALSTGARRGELLSLTWESIDLERGTASLAETKNGDRRTLILLPDVVEELKTFKPKNGNTGLVFASSKNPRRPMQFEKVWQEALAEAKIKGFVFHGLRHTAASHLAMAGASLTEVGDLLGHRTLAMTRRYSHLSTSHKADLVSRVFGDLR
jgi:integrase